MSVTILKMGDPQLLQRSVPVRDEELNSTALHELIDEMWRVMHEFGGIGLAAPQMGVFKRVMVYGFDVSERYPGVESILPRALINPQLEVVDDVVLDDWEGCLSVPGLRGLVPRYKAVRYRAVDVAGDVVEGVAVDFHARVLQHEVDHLDGVLFPQRIKDMRYFGFEDQALDLI